MVSVARTDVTYRAFQPSDLPAIRQLNKAWFPVRYDEGYYSCLIAGRLRNHRHPLFSSLAVVTCHAANGSGQCAVCRAQERRTAAAGTLTLGGVESGQTDTVPIVPADKGDDCQHIVGAVFGTLRSPRLHDGAAFLDTDPVADVEAFYILTIGVIPLFRRMGIARTLVSQCTAHAQAHPSCKAVYLHVLWTNAGAQKLYTAAGFQHFAHLRNFYYIRGRRDHADLFVLYINGGRPPRRPPPSRISVHSALSVVLVVATVSFALYLGWRAFESLRGSGKPLRPV